MLKKLFALASACILLCACGQGEIQNTEQRNNINITQTETETQEIAMQETTCTLLAVGDNIMHNTVVNAAKTADGYDFLPFYALLKDRISAADIAVVNQESPLGGPDYSPSGYPNFNGPQEVGRDLANVGFDVISHANNHAMDRGAGAVYDTIDFWDTYKDSGILMTGIYRNAEERDELRILERNGIKVGFLSYTYGTNGISLPKNNPDLVSLIDKERIKYDLERLNPECDVTVAIMHWGVEYTHKPTDEQRELARFLTENGADIIIGHHPHVIQPAEWIEFENGNRAFCVYSLGNFLSSQNKPETMLEGMLDITIKKDADGGITLENPKLTPLVNYYNKGWKKFLIYPLSEYTDEIAKTHSVGSNLTHEYFSKLSKDVFGEFCADE